jgi:hypothetical protein
LKRLEGKCLKDKERFASKIQGKNDQLSRVVKQLDSNGLFSDELKKLRTEIFMMQKDGLMGRESQLDSSAIKLHREVQGL